MKKDSKQEPPSERRGYTLEELVNGATPEAREIWAQLLRNFEKALPIIISDIEKRKASQNSEERDE